MTFTKLENNNRKKVSCGIKTVNTFDINSAGENEQIQLRTNGSPAKGLRPSASVTLFHKEWDLWKAQEVE